MRILYKIGINEILSQFQFIAIQQFQKFRKFDQTHIKVKQIGFQEQYTQVKKKSISSQMSLQKSLLTRPSIKNASQSTSLLYRVRNLSRNRSLKELTPINKQKNDLHFKIQRKYTADTSFFAKENRDSIQILSQQQLPKYSIIKTQNQKPKILKRTNHRILRKVNTCKVLPQNPPENIETEQNITSQKQSLIKISPRKVSLKKKVENIKKMHNQNKNYLLEQQFNKVQSEQVLGEKRKSRSKLKVLVRDPFQLIKTVERKKTDFPFLQSKIENSNDISMLSEANRRQIQQFLSCLN